MKVIIDIDERAHAGCVKLKNNDDMGILGFHLINATANGTLFEEELEKIKKEIEQDAFKDVNGSKYIFVNRINQIIDKYKVELKGENE
jgi:hypothetical protein